MTDENEKQTQETSEEDAQQNPDELAKLVSQNFKKLSICDDVVCRLKLF